MQHDKLEEAHSNTFADTTQVGAQGKFAAEIQQSNFSVLGKQNNSDVSVVKVAQANVADEPEEEQEAHNEGPQKPMFEQLRAENPKDLGPGLKTMQGLTEQFLSSPDKAKAMTQLKDGFEGAVKQTDKDFEDYKKTYGIEKAKLEPLIGPKQEAQEKAAIALQESFKKLPPDEQKRMQWALAGYKQAGNSKEMDNALAKEVGKHPGLMQNFNGYQKTTKELLPLAQKASELQKGMQGADSERIAGRMAYAEMLLMSGDTVRSKRMEREFRALIMGVPLTKVDELEQRDKQKH